MFRSLTRKWIACGVAVALLLAAVTAGDCFWRQGDSRFVGKWDIGPRCFGARQVGRWGTIEFRSNSTAVMQYSDGSAATIPFPWNAEASRLTFGEKFNSDPNLLEEILLNIRCIWAGSANFGLDEVTYDILLCTPDNIEVLAPAEECPFVLTRIAE